MNIKISDDGRIDRHVEKCVSTTPIGLDTLFSCQNMYILNAPYQRDNVWSIKNNLNLIRAIILGRPIPPIYTCIDRYDTSKRFVIDGKQRLSAVFNFMTNKFPIKFEINGVEEPIHYQDIVDKAAANVCGFSMILRNFRSYQISEIAYDGLTINEQIELFDEINTFIPVSPLEYTFGKYYYCRQLFNMLRQGLDQYFKHCRRIKNTERDGLTAYLAGITFNCFGTDFEGGFGIRSTSVAKSSSNSPGSFKEFLSRVHTKLESEARDKCFSYYTEDRLTKLPFFSKLTLLKKVCQKISDVLDSRGAPCGKNIHQNDLFDITIFFSELVIDKIVTFEMFNKDKEIFYEIIKKYIDIIDPQRSRLCSAIDTYLKRKKQIFDQIVPQFIADCNPKTKRITENEKTMALLNSGPISLISGENLTPHNIQFDHVDAASRCSSTEVRVLSADDNRMKSSLNATNAQNIANYISQSDPT